MNDAQAIEADHQHGGLVRQPPQYPPERGIQRLIAKPQRRLAQFGGDSGTVARMVGGAEMLPTSTIVENASKSADHTTLVAAVKAGRTFEQAAAASKMTALPAVVTSRQGSFQMDPAALQAAFELKLGDIAVVQGRGGEPWVARVDKIEPVDTAAAAVLRARVAPEVAQTLESDVREVFVRGLQKEVPIKRDEVAIQQYFQSYLSPEAP